MITAQIQTSVVLDECVETLKEFRKKNSLATEQDIQKLEAIMNLAKASYNNLLTISPDTWCFITNYRKHY